VQLGDLTGLGVFSEVLADHVAAPDRWDPKAIAAVVVAAGEHGLRESLPALRILARDNRFDRMFPGLAGRAMRAIDAGISGAEDTAVAARALPRDGGARDGEGAGGADPTADTGEADEDADTPPPAFVVAAAGPVDEDADTPVPGPLPTPGSSRPE
jgi:hypothetical protein